MMEKNNNVFLAGGDALLYFAEPMYKKYSTLFAAIHLLRTYLIADFLTPFPLYTSVHMLDDPASIPPIAYVLNGWPMSQLKNK